MNDTEPDQGLIDAEEKVSNEIAVRKRGFALNKEAINKNGRRKRNPVQKAVERVLAEATAYVDISLPPDKQVVEEMSRLDAIIRVAAIQAEAGNKDAREWLADRLEGKPRTRAHVTVGIDEKDPYDEMSDDELEELEREVLGGVDADKGNGIIQTPWEICEDRGDEDRGEDPVLETVRQRWPGR